MNELTITLGVHFIVTPSTFLHKVHCYLVFSLNFHIQLSVHVIIQNQLMCLYDTIVLFYALNTEQFHYKLRILPRVSRLSLQYSTKIH